MQATRERILEYLETNRMASAVELSRVFRMTAANLRHHLAVLEEQGLVEVVGQEPPEGRGRPSLLYMATRAAQQHNLAGLAEALLQESLGKRAGPPRAARLKRLAERLSGETEEARGSITQRLVAAVRRLNQLHYRAHWEPHPQGPRVILGRCPYAQIIDNHPELCQMDAHLLESLLGAPAEQTAKLARSPEGPPHCVFVVGAEKPD